ncbi:O-linked N-acetylglucosamine transferase, SPINDLY family protein [Roseibium sp. M-1]
MANETSLTILELISAAEALKTSGSHGAAEVLYGSWIAQNPDDPLLYAVLFNQSVLFSETGKLAAARETLQRALALNPEFHAAHINLGRVLEQEGDIGAAVGQWNKVLEQTLAVTPALLSSRLTALNQIARTLETANQDVLAESMLRQSLELDPRQREVAQHFIALRQRQCEWPVVQPLERVSAVDQVRAMSPLSAAAYSDDPLFQLGLAADYSRNDVGLPAAPLRAWAKARDHDGPLRIGYLSSDLREHAVGHLMAEVFGLHDRSRVEVFAYDCGVPADDALSRNFRATTDHWRTISAVDDETAARLIAEDGVQILVDVNGYTREGRTKLVAHRPAPVIVNWLGYPGTTASPFHHYIVADGVVVPDDHEIYFSEKVLRLPCYQPNNRQRVVSDRSFTRADFGLPEDGTVFCCFNGSHKITRFCLERWFAILKKVPGGVLWLLTGGEETDRRLRGLAETAGISPDRLVFAPKIANADHLARYPLADLFLDTTPYGAHTTASDALWMGVPVLTIAGRCFAARVCASLVTAAGLEELVCQTPDAYIRRAAELGRDRDALELLRQKLVAGRDSCTLFDTPLLVASLEDLYDRMWQDCTGGTLPRPRLEDLDALLDIGAAIDHETTDMLAVTDYRGFWRERLAARHDIHPLSGRRFPEFLGL